MISRLSFGFTSLISLSAALALTGAPLRVDLGLASDRKDTGARAWTEWQVPNGGAAERDFEGGVQARLQAGSGSELKGEWNRAAFVAGAPLVADGVTVRASRGPAVLELELRGLAAGRHTLTTFHNALEKDALPAFTLRVAGQPASAAVKATQQVTHDSEATTQFFTFDAVAGQPVLVRFEATAASGPSAVVLNGFAIDFPNPAQHARKPFPLDQDWHADADTGMLALRWQPAPVAGAKQQLHLVHAADAATADALLAASTAGQTVTGGEFAATVAAGDSLRHYRWRIDTIAADGTVTRGEPWAFRVRHLAFPGAEGYGRFALGGRGGRVIKVTNLNDSGPGSLRAAVEADGPRTVVFDVSGRIVLQSRLIVRNPYLTIAGQTAPGKGIVISNYNLGMLGTNDVIVRYLRVRPGNTAGKTLDGMGMASTDYAIIDHCSISWTQDESFSSRGAKNITLQRTLISEALNIAGHKKYGEGKAHGFAASISGDVGSFHHNLLAHCSGRNWSLAGGLDRAAVHAGRLDIRNNVVYNWATRTTDGGAKQVNFVNNYYKPGPATKVFHVLKPERAPFGPQDYYVAGNVMEGRYGPEAPLAGVLEPKEEPLKNFIKEQPFFPSFVTTQTAAEAYENVLADVGCNVPALDEHDQRVLRETRTGTTTYTGSKSGIPGLPDSQDDVGGWENYPEVHRAADWDSDGDGIPDVWETARGLNPRDPADGAAFAKGSGYTNLEIYLNALASQGARVTL